MGCGNPPGLSDPLKGHYKLDLTVETMEARDGVRATSYDNNSFETGLMSSSFTSPRNTVFPFFDIDMQETFQYLGKDWESTISRLDDLINPNSLTNSQPDVNLVNLNSLANSQPNANRINLDSSADSQPNANRINLNSLTDSQADENLMHPEFSRRGSYSNTGTSDDFLESGFDMNVRPAEGESAIGFPIKEFGAEAKTGGTSISQRCRDFSLPGCSTSALPHAENIGIAGLKNDMNIVPVQLGPTKDDGNFLTLGTRPNSNFSTQEVACKLDEAISSRPKDSLLAQNSSITRMESSSSRVRLDACESSSSAYNLHSRMPNTSPNSMQAYTLQNIQANESTHFPASSDTFRVNPVPALLASGRTSNPRIGRSNSSSSVSTSTHFTTHPAQDSCRQRFMGLSSKSPVNLPSDTHTQRGVSIRHAELGNLNPLGEGTRMQVTGIGSMPTSVQASGHLYLGSDNHSAEARENSSFPERNSFPDSVGNNIQFGGGGQFPKRLGYQPNNFDTTRGAQGNLLRDQYSGLVDYFQMPPHASGIRPSHLASQVGYFGSSLRASGQTQDHHSAPPEFLLDHPREDYSTDQIVSQESLKRPAVDLPTASSVGQRRRVNPSQPSNPYQGPIIPPPIPPPAHIPAFYQRQIIQPFIQGHRYPVPHQRPNVNQPSIPAHYNPVHYRNQTIQPPYQNRMISLAYQTQILQASYPRATHIQTNNQSQTTQSHIRAPNLVRRHVPPPLRAPNIVRPHVPPPFQSHTVRGPIGALNPVAAHIPAPHQSHTIRGPSSACNPAVARIPSAAHYIKWQGGVDVTPKPIGRKCFLCKRDLSFTAEGPVFQPTNPPPVAVLPCGHTFHDHCLQIIVPADQTKNPPCIPCAVGET